MQFVVYSKKKRSKQDAIIFFHLKKMNVLAWKNSILETEENEGRRRNDLRRAYNAHVLKGGKKRSRRKQPFPKPSKTGYTIYGAEWCPWCKKAKALLVKKGVSFCFYDVDSLPLYDREIRKLVKRDVTSIPQVFYRGRHIGGFSELDKKLKKAR